MKFRFLLSFTPASVFLGASALAAPIGGYDAWTVNAGVITATCPAGHTCTNLDGTGNGLLQQKMVDNGDTTVSYFRTIVTDEGVSASDLASVQALGFRVEGQIGLDGGGGNNYVNRSVTKSSVTLGNDAVNTMAEVSTGALQAGSLAVEVFDQEQFLGSINRKLDFHMLEQGRVLEINYNSSGAVPSGGVGNEGALTVRRREFVSSGGTLTLDSGGAQEQTLAYAAGNTVTAVWLTQAASGVGSFSNRTLGLQRYTVLTAGQSTNVGGTSIMASNADGAGNFNINVSPLLFVEIGGTQWGWDTALFGTRPQAYFGGQIGSTGFGLLAPPITGTFANDFPIP